ncbi:EAL domain-containing protein [Bowmanella sp. Y26]|uniref:EAL domain-containing protein n=1 Tax=Bowmanella yangjiangensis TaxID=2811230 RepID=UPI001BDBC9B9|nr:GGDEF and EAL domain-containing protein [Bowmanella yangjiangensis]MBT1063610.1 EAL domain-containing protein [Bowmanella yangjiangensis]
MHDHSSFYRSFQQFMQRSGEPMLLLRQGQLLASNQALLDVLGYQNDLLLQQMPLSSLCRSAEDNTQMHFAACLDAGQGSCNCQWLALNGEWLEAQCHFTRLVDEDEDILHVSLRFQDQFGPSANVQLQLYEQVFDSSNEAVVITDKHQKIAYANRAFCDLSGYTVNELVSQDIRLLRSGKHDDDFFLNITLQLMEKGFWSGELWDRNKQGQDFLCQVRLSAILDEYRRPCYFVGVYSDAGSHTGSLHQLRTLAYQDELTGLPNRALLMQLIPHQINQCRREGGSFGLMFLDLDRFKQVNDSMGHEAGDMLLRMVAERFSAVLRTSDTVARLGGDEFVVLVSHASGPESVSRVAEKIIQCLEKPFLIRGQAVEVGASIGISLFPQNTEQAAELLHQADIAMYRAKKSPESSFVFFCEDLNQELVHYKQVEQQIREGLKRGEFIPYYQPQVDSLTGQFVGVECLARWRHTSRGIIPATEFISVAERSGLIQEVFLQVLGQAIAHIGLWKQMYDRQIQVSVNISGHQFCDYQNIEQMSELLKESGLAPGSVKTEITESSLMDNGQYLLERLAWVKTAGFSIALDDFGSGYSSLRQLNILPVETLKIDRSYMSNMEDEPGDRLIIKAIIQLSKTLGIGVVAQGVERQEQVTFLQENGCHVMQGYHFSKPLPAAEFERLLAAQAG